MNKLWELIKTTLIEKDGTTPVYGSIKRWAAWILLFCVVLSVIQGLLPGGSLHIGSFLNLNWQHKDCNMDVLKALLEATGTYILTGQLLSNVTDTIQNYHNINAAPKPPDAPKG